MVKPVVLLIMDGWGIRKERKGNAIAQGKTPNYDSFIKKYPHSALFAHGEHVGLPKGYMGNSEVGHLNIGAGRIIYQKMSRMNIAINNGSFFKNEVLLETMKNVRKNDSCLHLMGLLSDAGVHSHTEHLFALLEMAKKNKLKNVCIHCITDGRDTLPGSAEKYIKKLERKIKEIGVGKIATLSGRYYVMDRDKRWKRVKKGYDAIVNAEGIKAESAINAFNEAKKRKETDEFIKPNVINGYEGMKKKDYTIFFNFRSDRARQISYAMTDKKFNHFKTNSTYNLVCMFQYDKNIKAKTAFPELEIKNNLGQIIAKNNLRQFRIAETEKYAHVTFFFNSGIEKPNKKEERMIIPSPKIATYDLKPEMSAYKVRDNLIRKIKSKKYDVIIVNFANPDMVGHTGIIKAAVKAVETVDECVGNVVREVKNIGGTILITADHGNCEEMLGDRKTSHTTNKIPFILVSDKKNVRLRNGILADIAPTILDVLKIKKPKDMTGKSLIAH